MEIDLIFLPKSKEKKTEDIKNEFKSILNSLFNDVSDIQFSVNCNNDTNNRGIVNYNYIVKNDRTLFLKLESYLSEKLVISVTAHFPYSSFAPEPSGWSLLNLSKSYITSF